mmetsp:Transcript_16077/g.14533  ORF Transcript_16077/g.14533 Transcript_16077/m.14533 type:complete len:424 (-) Transcript_16077:31-1302(-)
MSIPLKIGLFGAGVVGGGVIELISKNILKFNKLNINISISKICVKSIDKTRDFSVPSDAKFVTNYNELIEDPSINVIVELIGGTTTAKDLVFAAIKAGKHVVTANKALIAAYLPEIQQLLAENPTVSFNFEAAVCGGIPIIHSLQTDFLSDNIKKVMGIMNGTTNFMLSKMEDEGSDYNVVLKEAQALGYAEADPTADVEGHDVQAKIALLAKLGFGKTVPWESVPTKGISKVSAVDFEYAKLLRSTIKLIGTAQLNDDGSLAVFVSPNIVSLNNPLSSAKGPGNMVLVSSDNLNTSSFAGPGAGRYATANSVMNDIIRLAQGKTVNPFPLEVNLHINNDYSTRFYVRITCRDGLGIIRSVGEIAEKCGVSIHAILQNPITNIDHVDFVVTTDSVKLHQIDLFANEISKQVYAKNLPVYMPIL